MTNPSTPSANHPADQNGSSPLAPPTKKPEPPKGMLRKYGFYLWIAGAVGIILSAAGVYAALKMSIREPFTGPTWEVKKQKLQVTIVERGSLESAENSDIIVRVKAGARGSTNASIIKWVVDDGAQVKVGDPIVQLDDSGYQDTLKTQSNTLNQKKSDLIQAQTDHEIQKIQNETDIKAAEVNLSLSILTLTKYCGKGSAFRVQTLKTQDDVIKYLKEGFEADINKERDESSGKFTSLYFLEVGVLKGNIENALSDKVSWHDRSEWSQRMVKKGLYSESQADSDKSKYESADIALRKAQGDLDLYNKFDLEAKVTQYWSDVKIKERDLERVRKQADSKLKQKKADEDSKQAIFDQEQGRYDDLKKDEIFYKITSPQDGIVVYYVPEQSRFGSGSQQSIVAQGEPVREGQKLIRIPNLYKMLVNARVHEAMISKVEGEKIKLTGHSERLRAAFTVGRSDLWGMTAFNTGFEEMREQFKDQDQKVLYKGQKAGIRVDAHPGKQYHGRVKSKATVASQADFLSSDVKVYQTMVSVDDLSLEDGLRPGMSAEVSILAEETREMVLVIPIQSVVGNVAMGAKRKCYVLDAGGFPLQRDIVVGLSSDKMVQVLEGLEEGEKVVLNPRPLIPEKSDMKPGTPGGRRGSDFEEGGDAKKGGNKKKGGPSDPGSGPRSDGASFQRSENGSVDAQERKQGKKG